MGTKLYARMVAAVVILSAVMLGTTGPFANNAAYAAYPEKPINWIVMWRPGGGADTFTRILAGYLEKDLGQKIIVQNITGGAGAIGFTAAKTAKPDGYTLVTMLSDLVKYDIMKSAEISVDDFDLIGAAAQSNAIVVVKGDSPYKSMDDIVAAAKKNPGKVKVAVSDIGGYHHMPVAILEEKAGVEFSSISHPGTPKITAAILGGHVDVGISTLKPTKPYLDNGEIRLIASFGTNNLPGYAEIPTVKGAGYDVVWGGFSGVAGPKGMPEDVKATLAASLSRVLKNENLQKEFAKFGYVLNDEDAKAYRARLLSMQDTMRKIYIRLGLAK